ncbi:MAG TPA: cysteine desulfurase family protein [Candidatus Binataceae bacterium]|nr:cysteine desulfurase family protein [Candidatus Binataceae bacterium]
MSIYLDHNAGAPARPEAIAATARMLAGADGNPASVHRTGQRARRALEQARAQVAKLIGAAPREIVFTSGGTEANNFAISGALASAGKRRRVITSALEHSSILAPLGESETRGFEIVRIAPDGDGRVPPAAVIAALDDATALVTLGLVNAEVGSILDATPIAEAAARAGAIFHLDAAQAAGRIAINAHQPRCDLMTLSAHKLGGLAGVGALFIRAGITIAPQILGGPQEAAMRAGTPNLVGAVAFGVAAEAAGAAMETERARIETMAAAMLAGLRAGIPGVRLNGPRDARVANTLNLTFPGVLGESMLIALDLEGVEVSMGSACAAGAVEPSHVLLAMGRSAAEARSSLRISLGWNTAPAEIDAALAVITRVWRRVSQAEPLGAIAIGAVR